MVGFRQVKAAILRPAYTVHMIVRKYGRSEDLEIILLMKHDIENCLLSAIMQSVRVW